jgi:hypothetical protein
MRQCRVGNRCVVGKGSLSDGARWVHQLNLRLCQFLEPHMTL